jgi:hypothetical protein
MCGFTKGRNWVRLKMHQATDGVGVVLEVAVSVVTKITLKSLTQRPYLTTLTS